MNEEGDEEGEVALRIIGQPANGNAGVAVGGSRNNARYYQEDCLADEEEY